MADVESELTLNNASTQQDLPLLAATTTAGPAITSSTQQCGEWNAAYDYTSQKWYYYNLKTRETCWQPPPDWISNDGETPPISSNHESKQHGYYYYYYYYYYYRDIHGIDQGPFSVQQLLTWRGALPMDLPVWKMTDQKNEEKLIRESGVAAASTPAATQFFSLAEVLGDAALPNCTQWRT
jgi:hypothetical protein